MEMFKYYDETSSDTNDEMATAKATKQQAEKGNTHTHTSSFHIQAHPKMQWMNEWATENEMSSPNGTTLLCERHRTVLKFAVLCMNFMTFPLYLCIIFFHLQNKSNTLTK